MARKLGDGHDVIAIGASAGGVEALVTLIGGLPADLQAAVLVCLHIPAGTSVLPRILSRAGTLTAHHPHTGEVLEPGQVYVAPPDHHLLVADGSLRLVRGPVVNRARPAIDPLFASAADAYGPRLVAVVLSGMLDDGTEGLRWVKARGGVTVVQDPHDAAFPEMPLAALNRAKPQQVVGLAEMPTLLHRLVHQPASQRVPAPDAVRLEVEIARSGHSSMSDMEKIGRRSVLACPDCHGVMWEIDDGDLVRYRCHIGHAYTEDMMSLALDENVRRALASALRALEERIALAERLRSQASARGHNQTADTWADKKQEFETEADVIRKAIQRADEISAVGGVR